MSLYINTLWVIFLTNVGHVFFLYTPSRPTLLGLVRGYKRCVIRIIDMWDLVFPINLLAPNTIGFDAHINGGWPESVNSNTMIKLEFGLTHPYKIGL